MQKWNRNIQWNTDNYIVRCIDETFGPSGAGNPQIMLEFELQTETMEVAGEVYTIAGEKLRKYYQTQIIVDGIVNDEKSKNKQAEVKELYSKANMPNDNINYENPEKGFKGKLFHVRMYSAKEDARKSPTKEQLEKGIKQGDVIVNPITKLPVVYYKPAIAEIYGLAEENANKPY